MKKPVKNQTAGIAPEDAALFRAAAGKVKALPEQNRITPCAIPSKTLLRRTVTAPPIPEIIPDILSDFAGEQVADEFLRNGLSRMTLRKLRRGSWQIQDSLDLHGNHTDAARKLLQEFLHEAMRRKLRCVRIIHGKGLNSQNGEAVLRKLTRHWLTQHQQVLGFCDAPPQEGGSGAVLVLLRMSA